MTYCLPTTKSIAVISIATVLALHVEEMLTFHFREGKVMCKESMFLLVSLHWLGSGFGLRMDFRASKVKIDIHMGLFQ